MIDELIKRLRDKARASSVLGERYSAMLFGDAADMLEQQAARIAALESAAKAEPVAWTSSDRLTKIQQDGDHVDTMWGRQLAEYGDDNVPLYAAPTAATDKGDGRDAWQPIETAPKDGTPLLLFARSIQATASIPMIGWFLDEHGWIAQSFHGIDKIVPSHWMPRPEFPAALSQIAGE